MGFMLVYSLIFYPVFSSYYIGMQLSGSPLVDMQLSMLSKDEIIEGFTIVKKYFFLNGLIVVIGSFLISYMFIVLLTVPFSVEAYYIEYLSLRYSLFTQFRNDYTHFYGSVLHAIKWPFAGVLLLNYIYSGKTNFIMLFMRCLLFILAYFSVCSIASIACVLMFEEWGWLWSGILLLGGTILLSRLTNKRFETIFWKNWERELNAV